MGAPPGMLERQAQLEMRLEKVRGVIPRNMARSMEALDECYHCHGDTWRYLSDASGKWAIWGFQCHKVMCCCAIAFSPCGLPAASLRLLRGHRWRRGRTS